MPTSFRLAIALLLSAMLVSGCSSSSDSSSSDDGAAVASDTITSATGDTSASDDVTAINENIDESLNETIDDSSTEGGSQTSDVSSPETTTVTSTDPTPEISAPSALATTRVTFDITVPVVVSNSLQVRLVWGDKDFTANWVVDESWSVSDDFPTGTNNRLAVTFSDQNGAVTLGSFEQNFITGTTASESFRIIANQFDTDQWDSDSDGVSNLDELISGTNPTSDDVLQPVLASLEIMPDKTFRISWAASEGADLYRVLENSDGVSGFTQISDDLEPTIQTFDHRVALYNRVNARYIVQECLPLPDSPNHYSDTTLLQ